MHLSCLQFIVSVLLFPPGFALARCDVSKEGSNRNSNHKIVSADKGTVLGLNGSSIMFLISKLFQKIRLIRAANCKQSGELRVK